MSKKVDGYLAEDGTFFSIESECIRYERQKELEGLCDSHGINFENFMATINAWHATIKGYFDADDKCKIKQAGQAQEPHFDDPIEQSSLLRTEDDISDAPIGDRNAPGFLEQQIRRNF